MTVLVPSRRIGQERRQARDLDAAAHLTVVVDPAEQRLGHVAARLGHQLDGGELRRFVVVGPAGQRVADEHLDRRRDRRDGERDEEPEPVVPVPATTQHADGVDRRDHEPADEVGGDEHVARLVGHRVVEHDVDRIDIGHPAGAVEGEAGRLVHPGVGRHHRDRPPDPADHDRHAGPPVGPGLQALPPVEVDGDEDGLEEEEDPLDGERDPERRTEAVHELRPQQPELEAEDRSVTAPTAKVTAMNFDQRCASFIASASPRFMPR